MMKKYQLTIFLLTAILLSTCNKKKKSVNNNKLSGLWSLHIMEQQDSISKEWKEWKSGMQGFLLYDEKNNMSLHLTSKGYQNTDFRFPNFTDTISIDALKYLTNSYVYFAKYTVFEEDSIVQHARFSHSNPGDWNKVVQRRFSFIGDTLVLKPVENKNSRLRLKWVKQK